MMRINRVAVLGSGVMGAAISAHLANAGLNVLMLDIVPREMTEEESAAGLTLESAEVRNRLANHSLNNAVSTKPAAFFLKQYADNVTVGNFEDDISKIKGCDWVLEAVLENMEIKKNLFAEKVVPFLDEGAILTTNTSGLSVNEMAEALPEDVRKRFFVTHFFNPPRYMRLLEIVPCRYTDPEVVLSMAEFLSKRLGKGIVHAKDTPNFIANRIGLYSIFSAMKNMADMELTVEEVDAVSGVATARPKSAIFRTTDLVGVDLLVRVGQNSYEALVNDEEREIFKIPPFLKTMVDNGLLGAKCGKGFYRKEKDEEGKSVIFYYDYPTGEFKQSEKPKFPSVQSTKMVDDPVKRLKMVLAGKDKAAQFAWRNLRDTLLYTFRRIPEIADDVVNVDNAMKWGFNWELGPFEILDAIGIPDFVKRVEEDGVAVPDELRKVESFYSHGEAGKLYFDMASGQYRDMKDDPGQVKLEIIKRTGGEVEKNANSSLLDIGDGVFLLEFHSKMNAISSDILSMTLKAVKRAEADGLGLVVGNQGALFSAGANIMLLAVAIAEGAYDDIDMMVRSFQKATMSLKYAKVPVVAAPFNLTLGGGAEYTLHADLVNAHAETYMGLVELGVGLLPAGGGTKEMAVRAILEADAYNTDVTPFIVKYFTQIGLATVSMSGAELFDLGYLRPGDSITMDISRLIGDAKTKAMAMAKTYRPKNPLENLKAPGRSVAASLKSQLWNMKMAGYATAYDVEIAGQVARVITGGDVPSGTIISEQYLLDLEREAFLKLCGNRKTLERIQHMLKKGKPLRN